MIISHNLTAINTFNSMKKLNNKYSGTYEKLSSGFRINSASDDAAGLAISEKMRAQIIGLQQAQRNIQDDVSLIQTAEGGLASIQSSLQRLRELAIQSSNDTLTQEDRESIQEEVTLGLQHIDGTADQTKFNNIDLLNVEVVTNVIGYSDEITWENSNYTGFEDTTFFSLDWNGEFYIAGGYDGQLLKSYDGDNWFDPLGYPNGLNIHSINWDGENFLITESNHVYTSPDGVTRIGYYFKNNNGGFFDSNFVGGKYITVGDSGLIAVSDSSTGPWNEQISGTSELLNSVASNGENYVVVGMNGTILTSVDAINWTDNSNIAVGQINNVIWADNQYIATSHSEILTSPDGENWSVHNIDFIATGIIYDGNKLIATSNHNVYESSDGINWTENNNGLSVSGGSIEDIVYTGDDYMMIGRGGYAFKGTKEAITEQIKPTLSLQIGANAQDSFSLELIDVRTLTLGIDHIDLSTAENAEESLDKIDSALSTVSSERSKLGAYQNRLEHALSISINYEENLSSAKSRIINVNMAKEMMEMTKMNILSQASQSLLAQAVQNPQAILELLQ
ncbi:flagellin N-terminal helical domain-containing protein [Chengkuizengella axinellae]|uniref:Flagellin n=1 Tax=Chengkuizengella axinellae TaxID=3064388 RepID=A0ABT9IZI2_9BACL|nr:flagellin [Chengkuizengella sp. 2205SS18-9]MDP5274199.1 flagellin [Chengkuizengella sp. 2205SS18-9]